jgi:hypothetical protein
VRVPDLQAVEEGQGVTLELVRVHDWQGPIKPPLGLFDWFVCRNEGCYITLCLKPGERPVEGLTCVDVRAVADGSRP